MLRSIFNDELGLDITEALPIIRSWGLDHVDLRTRVFGKYFERITPEQLAEVKGLIEQHGFKVTCLQSSLAKVHLPDKERRQEEADKLESVIRAADVLDCRLVRAFFYWQPPKEEKGQLAVRPDALQQVLDYFEPLAERAKQAGLVLAFENCGVMTSEVLAVLDSLGVPTWGLAWDVANEWGCDECVENEAAYIQRLAKVTKAVHVKARGAVEGVGNPIPYDRVLQTLDNAGLAGPVSAETHNPDPKVSHVDQSKKVVETIQRAWPTAAPGMLSHAAEAPRTDVTRDYEPVGFVVVGLGMGRSRAKTVKDTPGTKLLGVCDIDEERAKATGETLDVPYTTDLKPWLDNDQVEVVYVLTPTGRHAEVGLQALQAGKHVLTTKPMEASLAACDEMIRAAESRKLLLGVDFAMRIEPQMQSLKAAIENKCLGRILGAEVSLKVLRTMDYFNSNGGWRGMRRWDGGGVLSNQCVHHTDEVAYALGIPEKVRCNIWTQNHEIEAEDLGCAAWQYADGSVLTLLATTCYPHSTWYFRVEIHGTEGAVSLSEGGPLDGRQERWFIDGAWSDAAPEKVESEWLNCADNFAAALRTGADLVCPGRDGRRTQSILDAMYRSAYGDGNWVAVNPELD